jgi:hypothetical protein
MMRMGAPRKTSARIITRRRSNRSLITPLTSRKSTCGKVQATPTTESAVGAFESSYTCHAIATK